MLIRWVNKFVIAFHEGSAVKVSHFGIQFHVVSEICTRVENEDFLQFLVQFCVGSSAKRVVGNMEVAGIGYVEERYKEEREFK